MRNNGFVAGLALLALLLLAAPAPAGWWDKVADAETVDLEEVIQNPHSFRGREVTFECTFQQISTFYNAYYTRFVPSEYVNFSVWPTSRELWKEEDFTSSFSFCFLEKDNKNLKTLMGMSRFTRLRLHGYVQNTFKNTPWIEVRHVEILDEVFSKDTLRKIILGDRAVDEGDHAAALRLYDSAQDKNLPAETQAGLARKRAIALFGMGRTGEAVATLRQALEISPGDKEARELLAKWQGDPDGADGMPGAAPRPATVQQGPVEVSPVDPARYRTEPKAMPRPMEEPVVAPTVVPVEEPSEAAPPSPKAGPEEPSTAPATPETEEEDPAGKPAPKKRITGPI